MPDQNRPEITTLVFDIGGVILDDTDGPLLKMLGCTKEKLEELKRIAFGEGWADVMVGKMRQRDYLQEKIVEYPEAAQELEIILAPEYQAQILPLRAKNVEFLRQIHSQGRYKMYFLSNLCDAEYDYLENRGIIEMLDGGAFSCKDGTKKPQPEFYEILYKRYNLIPEECWFFDDKERNIKAGKQLGMRGSVVPSLNMLEKIVSDIIR